MRGADPPLKSRDERREKLPEMDISMLDCGLSAHPIMHPILSITLEIEIYVHRSVEPHKCVCDFATLLYLRNLYSALYLEYQDDLKKAGSIPFEPYEKMWRFVTRKNIRTTNKVSLTVECVILYILIVFICAQSTSAKLQPHIRINYSK